MKKIKIKFVDFWGHWNQENNFITNCLREKYEVEFSDNPDYVFYSHFDKRCKQMDYEDAVKIFYTQENICPDFNFCDYAISYENLEYGDRHMQFPICFIEERYGNDWRRMEQKHVLEAEKASYVNRDFCSFVVSNGEGNPIRTEMFEKLCAYKKVNSGGRYLNNIGIPDGVPDKFEFNKKHKFSLCFENSAHPGYVTEKIVEGFAAQTIPIYWGASDVTKFFNADSFIDVSKYETIEDAIAFIERVDQDDELYFQMLTAPALNEDCVNLWEEKQMELKGFLYHIIEQEKQSAYRRNRIFWGERYTGLYKEMRDLYLFCVQEKLGRMMRKIINHMKR